MTITAKTTTRTSSLTSTSSTRPTLTSSASLERVLSRCQKAASDHLTRGKALVLQYNAKLDPNMTMTKTMPGSMPAPKSNIWWSHHATRS